MWCFISLSRSKRLLVGICYRTPSSTNENNKNLTELLAATQTIKADGLLLMGDFNFPTINWEEGIVNDTEESEAAQFYETTQDLFLYQHIRFPTRFREGHNPSCLDLIFSDQQHVVEDVVEDEPLGKSDHVTVKWNYLYDEHPKERSKKSAQSCRFNYRKGNYTEMNNALSSIDWSCLKLMSVEEAWTCIKDTIKNYILTCLYHIWAQKRN